jgi:hypothetical protein
MKIAFGIVMAAGLASAALASGPNGSSNPNWNHLKTGMQAIDEATGGGGSFADAATTRYDNYTNPPSALLTSLNTGLNVEWADDLTLIAAPGSNQITSFGWNVVNNNTVAMTSSTLVIRFYDSAGNLLLTNDGFGGYQFSLPSIAAGSSSRFTSNPVAIAQAVTIPAASANFVYMSTTYTAATFAAGGTAANIGFGIRGPIGVGASTDNIFNVTAGTSGNFGGSPLANFGLKVITDVPAPASVALLGLGGLVASRRRRA